MINDVLLQHGIGKSGGKNIKSIQSGYTLFSNLETAKNLSIDNVDVNKSVIKVRTVSIKSLYLSQLSVVGEIINSNTVNLTRELGGGMTNELFVYWEVIEFNNVKKIQKGNTLISSVFDSVTQTYASEITIEPVNAEKSTTIFSFKSASNINNIIDSYVSLRLENSSKIKVNSARNTLFTLNWQVLEFE